jgi:hypothetical protein
MDNPVDGTDGKLGRGFMSANKLEEVDIGNGDKPRPTFISANLESDFREELIKLLKEYKDCFAWDYSKMPSLDRSIVEHRLPIKSSFKPYKQPPRKIYKDEVLADVEKDVERLLDANFIRPCRYAEWISNIVPVYKKNGKMRVCIDFRDLNRATPMDGYPLPVADLLVDAAAGHKVISFMDGNAGYCCMDLPGPTTSVGTRTDYSVGPWDNPARATRHLKAWSTRTTEEKYLVRKLYMSCAIWKTPRRT